MSRTPDLELLGRRDLLVICWEHVQSIYGPLDPMAQRELHRLCRPAETLTDDEFLEHKRATLEVGPSLAQRAGKHYNVNFTKYKQYADIFGGTHVGQIHRAIQIEHTRANADPTQKYSMVVRPISRPENDYDKFAKALIEFARQEDQKAS